MTNTKLETTAAFDECDILDTNHDPYENLANAIIVLAVKDYKEALEDLETNYNDKDANKDKRSLERFFRSSWFEMLTAVDGDLIIHNVRETVRPGGEKWHLLKGT